MPKKNLTKRELDIINLKLNGFKDKAIATKLCISYWTVRQHLDNIKSKLDCRNLYQAIVMVNKIQG